MCIAILNTNKKINKKKLNTCWDNNDDGAGMLYIKDGVLVAEKFPNEGFNSKANFQKFYDRYNEVKSSESGELPMLLHFRIATHGTTPDYLHPFFVSPSLGLVHNGVIQGFGTAAHSDTAEFTELLSTMPGATTCEFLDIPFVEDSIYMYLGTGNKLIFLDESGDYRIFNEKLGEWIDGDWFSNDSHTKSIRYYGSTAVYDKKSTASPYGYKWDAWDDMLEEDEIRAYNNSFIPAYSNSSVKFLDEKFDCPVCEKKQYVNDNAECITCWTYIEGSVDKVMDKWDTVEYEKALAKYGKQ